MDKFTTFLEKILLPIARKLNTNRYLGALRDGYECFTYDYIWINLCCFS